MRLVVQRVKKASVSVNETCNKIKDGLVVFVGFTQGDNIDDIKYLIDKLINLRIFGDDLGLMNKSVIDINGEILSISQFTLYADCKKGRRPSFVSALKSDEASILYDEFNRLLKEKINIKTGVFGGDMLISLDNDGPVTIILESRS
ncbi:MAG: D-aminoacyl-tRNA deacylase [Mycoplasmatota bacterium]